VVLFARAMLEAAAELPPLRAVIGHSMGGASVLLACSGACVPKRLVSIAARAVPGRAARLRPHLGLPARARAAFIRQVERTSACRCALDVAGISWICRAWSCMPKMTWCRPMNRRHPQGLVRQPPAALEEGGHQRVLADPRLGEACSNCWPRSRTARQSA
jgi:hypothetical protein